MHLSLSARVPLQLYVLNPCLLLVICRDAFVPLGLCAVMISIIMHFCLCAFVPLCSYTFTPLINKSLNFSTLRLYAFTSLCIDGFKRFMPL